jgi:hypothetical protein
MVFRAVPAKFCRRRRNPSMTQKDIEHLGSCTTSASSSIMALVEGLLVRLALKSRLPPSAHAKLDNANRNVIPTLLQFGTTRIASSSASHTKNRKAAISRSIASNNRITKSSLGSEQKQQQQVEGIFGLRPIDYSIEPPIPHSPPPPPAKPGLQKYLFPFTLAFTATTVGYFYMNNKNDNYEYW